MAVGEDMVSTRTGNAGAASLAADGARNGAGGAVRERAMRLDEHIDFSTLAWVKPQIVELLSEARQALEAYAEDADARLMQGCILLLHRVAGSLRMVESFGAAELAAEMELLAQAVLDGGIASRDDALGALMRGLVQLPDYLDLVESGRKDIPVVLMPLINELREARGAGPADPLTLFHPDIDRPLPPEAAGARAPYPFADLRQRSSQVRGRFGEQLLAWTQGRRPDFAEMCACMDALREVCHAESARRLWWVSAGVLEALGQNRLDHHLTTLREQFGQLDRGIQSMQDEGEEALNDADVREFVRALLFSVTQAAPGPGRTEAIARSFALEEMLPSEEELARARAMMSGRNRTLLDTVAKAVREDLLRVKEGLDIFLRRADHDVQQLAPHVETMHRVGDTLAMLGLDTPARIIRQQLEVVSAIIDGSRAAAPETVLDVASALLYVDASLDEQLDRVGGAAGDGEALPSGEARKIVRALMREAGTNLGTVKRLITAFIESSWSHEQLADVPKLLAEVAGALHILDLERPARLIDGIDCYVADELIAGRRIPTVEEMDALADAMASVEYYLELGRESSASDSRILDTAERSLEFLHYWPLPEERIVATRTPASPVGEAPAGPAAPAEPVLPVAERTIVPTVVDIPLSADAEGAIRSAPVIPGVGPGKWVEVDEETLEPIAAGAEPDPDTAFQDASGVDEEIREVFIEELGEQIANIHVNLPAWKAEPANLDALRELRRSFHTLKGSGRLVGAVALGEFSWKIENMLNRVLDHAIEPDANVQEVVDAAVATLPKLLSALRGESVIIDLPLQATMQTADKLAAGEAARIGDLLQGYRKRVRKVRRWVPLAEPAPAAEPVVAPVPAADTLDMQLPPVDAILLDVLRTEVAQHLQVMRDYLAANAGCDVPVHEKLVRSAHTLHGAVAMVGVKSLASILGPLEGWLRRVHGAGAPLDREGCDALRDVAAMTEHVMAQFGVPVPDLPDPTALTERLEALRDRWAEAPAAPGFHGEAPLADHAEQERLAAEKTEQERIAAEQAEHERVAAEKAEQERVAAEQAEQERLAAEKAEQERIAAEQAEHERVAAEQAEQERLAAEHAEQERVAAGQAEQERLAAEQAEQERLAAEKAEQERTAAEHAEQERLAADQAEQERVAFEHAEQERLAADQAEQERLAAEKAEQERTAAEHAEQERVAAERAEHERLAAEKAEQERIAAEQAEQERIAAEQAERERLAAEQAEQERAAAEQAERERISAEQAERERIAAEKAEEERLAAERAEQERLVAERAEQERIAAEQAERERIAAEKAEQERLAAEKVERKRIAAAREIAAREIAAAALPPFPDDPQPDGALDSTAIDPELVELFTDEGMELLDASDGLVAALRSTAGDLDSVRGLQRNLHTLKGGARVVGIAPVGDLAHAMETLLEKIGNQKRELAPIEVDSLERGFDRLQELVQRVVQGKAVATPVHAVERFAALAAGRPVVAAGVEAPQPLAAVEAPRLPPPPVALPVVDIEETRAPAELVRVRSDLLDSLVNAAGEVSIYRARLEQQLGHFRFNLIELDQTVSRLREQLRKLEIETETQILSRYQREGDAGQGAMFDPLELDRFSNLQQYSRALAESVSDLVSIEDILAEQTRQSETLLLQQSRVSSDLQDGLMRTRMIPFESMVPNLRRTLRGAADELGKRAQLRVLGAQGEMDRSVLERMKAPFEHMLRNALAHGIEDPAQRVAIGKPMEGTVTIEVGRQGTEVLVRVSDDGAGFDRDAIRAKAIERGLLKPDAVVADAELFNFVLQTGFSTASAVTQLAGRGVGMDVVANEILQLGGSLTIESERGRGTTFDVRLPFTLAVTQAITVRAGDTTFAVPMTSIEAISRIRRDDMVAHLEGGDATVAYMDDHYRLQDLSDLLGLPASAAAEDHGAWQPLLMVRAGDLRAAVHVDSVIGSREIVVKPVGPQISNVPGVFGATILGDGSVMLILDPVPLVRHVLARQAGTEPETPVPAPPEIEQPRREAAGPAVVMVVDDSITIRKVTTRVLERERFAVITAKDGMDALEKLQAHVPDVMLLDIEMPRMDGYELATRMKNDLRLRHVPIIMITSRTGEKHRQRALEIGVERYLGKPYSEADLLHYVHELLETRRA